MDQSVNIPWVSGMNYGMGVNLLTGDIAGKAIKPIEDPDKEILKPLQAGGQTVAYDLVQINSMEELYNSIGMSVEVSGRYGLFNASAKAKYANESKFNSQSTFLLAKCRVMNAFTQIEDPWIKDEAIALYGDEKKFRDRYGDGYVRGIQTGGELFVIISITSSTKEEQQSIAAALRASYGTKMTRAQASVDIDAATQSKMARSELRVSTYQRGGVGEQQALVETIDAAIERLKVFPSEVAKNPVPYEVQVANYYTLTFPETVINPVDLENQKDTLEEYARHQLKYIALRNDVEFMQLHPEYYENSIDIQTLNRWSSFFTRKISDLRKAASRCANDASACEMASSQFSVDDAAEGLSQDYGLQLPSDFSSFFEAQSKRKVQNFEVALRYYMEVVREIALSPDVTLFNTYVTDQSLILPYWILQKPGLLDKPNIFKSKKAFDDHITDGEGKESDEYKGPTALLLSLVDERQKLYGDMRVDGGTHSGENS